MKKVLSILVIAAIEAAIMTTISCTSAPPPLMYERGDYAEYTPLAVQNIEGAPEQILTTAGRSGIADVYQGISDL